MTTTQAYLLIVFLFTSFSRISAQESASSAPTPPKNFPELQWLNLEDNTWGVPVAGDRVNVRFEPSENGELQGQLAIGEWVEILDMKDKEVTIQGKKGKWAKVKSHRQNLEGWVFEYYLGTRNRMHSNREMNLASISYNFNWRKVNQMKAQVQHYFFPAGQADRYMGQYDRFEPKELVKWEGNVYRYRDLFGLEKTPGALELVFFFPNGTRQVVGRRGIENYEGQLYPFLRGRELQKPTFADFESLFESLDPGKSLFLKAPERSIEVPSPLREGYYITIDYADFFPKDHFKDELSFGKADYGSLIEDVGNGFGGFGYKAHNKIAINDTYIGFIVSWHMEEGHEGAIEYVMWMWNKNRKQMEGAIALCGLSTWGSYSGDGNTPTNAWIEDVNGDKMLDVACYTVDDWIPNEEDNDPENVRSHEESCKHYPIYLEGFTKIDSCPAPLIPKYKPVSQEDKPEK